MHYPLDTQHRLVCSYTLTHTSTRRKQSLRRGGTPAGVSGRRQWLMNPLHSLILLPPYIPATPLLSHPSFFLLFYTLLPPAHVPFFSSLCLFPFICWPQFLTPSVITPPRSPVISCSSPSPFPSLFSPYLSITFIFTHLYLLPPLLALWRCHSVSLHWASLGFRGTD